MNRTVGSILAALLALPDAFALPTGGGEAAEDACELGSIKRELWATEAAVDVAAANLRGLQAIAGDSQAYEPSLATQLRDRAVGRLVEAEQHLSQLWRTPGQEDGMLRQVASLQDAVRRLRERVQKLGQSTRAQVEPRPDTRRGASADPQGVRPAGPAPGKRAGPMPPADSEAMLDARAEIKTALAQVGQVEDQARKLTERYGIADALPGR
ncbi:MAG: hypothetical protein NVSMB23_10320 [Myxococcales bacterium]